MRSGQALAFGTLFGAAFGLIAGLAEAIGSPLTTPWRVPFLLGADGLLGAGWGLAAALPLLFMPGRRARGLGTCARFVVTWTLFPGLAAALGLVANRVLLSGTHFLSRTSLLADVVAVAVALAIALGLGRLAAVVFRDAPAPSARVAGLVALALFAGVLPPFVLLERGTPDDARPSIVVVSIDTLRPDQLGAGGFPDGTSPEIDRMCREGVQYAEALAVSPGSAASHAALFTSRYPVSNGVWANFSIMNEEIETMAEWLNDRGYRTGGFATNTFLGHRFHFDQGFDAYVESGQVERLTESSPSALFRSLALVQIVDRVRVRVRAGYDPSFETALRWIRESRRPTFFFVHIMDVHSPYAPPHPLGPRFGADPSGGRPGEGRKNRFGWRPSEEAYTAEVRFADSKMGRLRRTLEALNRLDNSVLILTSDHGENLLDQVPNYSHGQTLFDATLRILAALRAPGLGVAPHLEPAALENVDLLPTLTDLLGWDTPDEWEGTSFHGGAPERTRPMFAQLNRDFAIRTPEQKLVVRADGGRDFYQLRDDPGETRSALISPRDRKALERALADWLASTTTEYYQERATSVAPEDLTPELREKLRALGYVE